jgi:hypothetical protein
VTIIISDLNILRYHLSHLQRIAHEKVEEQRRQLEEQEKQVALLRARIALLEGTANDEQQESGNHGGSSVDDFSIKVCLRIFMSAGTTL